MTMASIGTSGGEWISLHELYKNDPGTQINVETNSWQDRETLTSRLVLSAGTQTIKVTYTNQFWDEAARVGGRVYLDRLDVLDDQGRRVTIVEFEDVDVPVAHLGVIAGQPRSTSGTGDAEISSSCGAVIEQCALRIEFEAVTSGAYTAEVIAWSNGV